MTYSGALTDNTLEIAMLPAGFAGEISTATPGEVRLIVASVTLLRDRFETVP